MLLRSVPIPDPQRRRAAEGGVRSAGLGKTPQTGCAFADRCPRVEAVCRKELPALRELAPGHLAACHLI